MSAKDFIKKWGLRTMLATQAVLVTPKAPATTPPPIRTHTPSAQTTATPTAQELIDQGRISFNYTIEGKNQQEKREQFQQWEEGIKTAIQDILDDRTLSPGFVHRLTKDTLTFNLDAHADNHGKNTINLNLQDKSQAYYVDLQTGKAVPLSEHRIAVHEMVHFIQNGALKAFYRENQAVMHTDRVMKKYDEPPRITYILTTIKRPRNAPKFDFYQEGETYPSKRGDFEMPSMKKLDRSIFYIQLAATQQQHSPEDTKLFAASAARAIEEHNKDGHLDYMKCAKTLKRLDRFMEVDSYITTALEDKDFTKKERNNIPYFSNVDVNYSRGKDSWTVWIQSDRFAKTHCVQTK